MHLFAGLGNPGPKYQNNRHNIGFWAADALVRRFSLSGPKAKFNAEVFEGRLGDDKVVVLKPQTFMNESGQAIGAAMRFYKLTPADVTVLYDELDLTPCKVKARLGGGAAGHNGIRSTTGHIGEAYQRVRIGIGHPGHKDRVHTHVLGDFAKAETADFEKLAEDIAAVADYLAAGNLPRFMTELALRRQEDPAPAPKAAAKKAPPKQKGATSAAAGDKSSTKDLGPMATALANLKNSLQKKD